jgi:hypothetical protein
VLKLTRLREPKGIGERASVVAVQKFLVSLNIRRIRAQLSAADGVAYTDDDVRKWLQDAGFESQGEKWIVSETDLGHVDPSEVVEITPLDP